MDSAGFRFVRGEGSRINGLDAFIGEYQGQMQDLGQVTARAAHIAYDGKVYIVAGLAAPAAFQQSDASFLTSIRSFRSMTAAEAENIRPNRVDFYVVRAGDTWASIAERSGGVITAATLAVMNNSTPGSSLQPGNRIKIVVGG
jgi:predicted Zn-dependent protease